MCMKVQIIMSIMKEMIENQLVCLEQTQAHTMFTFRAKVERKSFLTNPFYKCVQIVPYNCFYLISHTNQQIFKS